MDITLIIEIIILVILILLSAFFSGVETALTSMTKLRIKQLLEKEVSKTNVINVWVKKSDKLLISLLVGNNIANIGAASLGALVVERLLPAGGSFSKAVAISWGLVTFLILTFGEIVPKSFARKHAEKVSIVCLPYLIVISFILTPFNKIFLLIVRVFMRIIGSKYEVPPAKITEEEIKTIVSVGGKEGVIPEQEKELIHSIFEFGDTIVREIMTPRVDIIAVSEHESLESTKNLIRKTFYSKIPVYRKNLDDIKGIFYAKDFIVEKAGKIEKGTSLKASNITRGAFFVPETKRISALLKEMQRKKVHIAIVLDEYGGTSGLVTLEDILEEIVGEIRDEFDVDEHPITAIGENEYIFDARLSIDEINKFLDGKVRMLEGDDYDTVGGFIIEYLGKIPKQGDKINIENFTIDVLKADDKTVRSIKLTIRVKKEEKNVKED